MTEQEQEQIIAIEDARQRSAAAEFLTRHLDFHRCLQNSEVISDYLTDNGLDWTAENLEEAFTKTESRLLKVPAAASATPAVLAARTPPAPVVPEEEEEQPQGLTAREIKAWSSTRLKKEIRDPGRLREINKILAEEESAL